MRWTREDEGRKAIANDDHVVEVKYAVRCACKSARLSWTSIGQRGGFPYETVPLPNMVHRVLLLAVPCDRQFSFRADRRGARGESQSFRVGAIRTAMDRARSTK